MNRPKTTGHAVNTTTKRTTDEKALSPVHVPKKIPPQTLVETVRRGVAAAATATARSALGGGQAGVGTLERARHWALPSATLTTTTTSTTTTTKL